MTKICPNCNNKFEPKNTRQIYCKSSCKVSLWQKRNGVSKPDFLKPKNENIGQIEYEFVTKEREVTKQRDNPQYLNILKAYNSQRNEIDILRNRKEELINLRAKHIQRNEQAIGTLLGFGTGLAITKNFLGAFAFGLAGNLIGKEQEKAKDFEFIPKIERIDNTIMNIEREITNKEIAASIQYNYLKTLPKKESQIVTETYIEKIPKKTEESLNLGEIPLKTLEKIPLIKSNSEIISLTELKEMSFETLNFSDEWKAILNTPQPNFRMMIYGESGHGKSHFTAKFAAYLANNFGKVLYNAAEEGLNISLQNKMLGLDAKYMDISSHRTFDKLKKAIKLYRFVIIDSINEMNLKPSELKELWEIDKKKGFIYIMQVTKQGDFKGDNQFKHDADIVLKIENRTPIIEKNRYR